MPSPAQPARYLTVAEVADILRASTWTVLRLCRNKTLPATKPAGTWLIAEADLLAHIESRHNQREAS